MICQKAAKYNPFWTGDEKALGRVRIFLTKKWVILSWLAQWFVISVMSDYTPKYGLDDSEKENFSDSPINIVRKLGEKEALVIAEGFNGHFASNAKDFEDQHEVYEYGVKNKERESLWRSVEVCGAIKLTVENVGNVNSGRSLCSKEKPKELVERYKSRT